MSTWGEIIREARQTKGLTQTALADALGVTQATIARWEAGGIRPPAEIRPLIDYLDIPWSALEPHGNGS